MSGTAEDGDITVAVMALRLMRITQPLMRPDIAEKVFTERMAIPTHPEALIVQWLGFDVTPAALDRRYAVWVAFTPSEDEHWFIGDLTSRSERMVTNMGLAEFCAEQGLSLRDTLYSITGRIGDVVIGYANDYRTYAQELDTFEYSLRHP